MFTLEIAGKPIAVTDASEDDAREVLESETFKADLMQIESGGAPLWDGFATLSVRPATRAEIAAFEATPMAEGGRSGQNRTADHVSRRHRRTRRTVRRQRHRVQSRTALSWVEALWWVGSLR